MFEAMAASKVTQVKVGMELEITKEEISLRNNRRRARARLLPRSSAEVGRRRYLEPITLRSSVAQSRV